MARLLFFDYHNMVVILEKGEHNTDFHHMVDFLEASPLRYALTVKPSVYVSHIRQFWSTARIETTEEGTKILVTVDGIVRTVSESSLRRNLKLRDEEGISSLPDAKLFENLTLMGYNISSNQKFTFQKGQFSHQWKYLIYTIMQCLSPKSTWFNEFSSNIATALVCLATNRTYNFSKMIFDGLVKLTTRIVPLFDAMLVPQGEGSRTPTKPYHTPSPAAQTPSHTTQPTSSIPPISTTSIPTVTPTETTPIRDVSQGEACPIDSGFIADQDRATMAKSSTLPHDSSPRAQEVEILKLQERVKVLEDKEGVAATRSRDDAPIKRMSMDMDEEEAATERISDDTEEMATVLTSIDVATVLAGGIDDVPTGSGSIPTAGPPAANIPTGSDVVPTASPVFATASLVTSYSIKKGKEVMVESDTPKKQRLQEQIDAQVAKELEEQQEREDKRMSEQIARDAEVARIHAEEELQSMIDGLDRNNKTIAKYLQEYQQFAAELPLERRIELIIIRNNLGWKVKDFKGMTFEEVEAKFNSVYKQMEDFNLMGSKEEAERYKRKGIRFDQESSKKLKSSEEVIEEAKSTDEIPKEKIKEMMQLIPIEEVYVEALQVKYLIIDWKVHKEGQRSYWKIIRLGGSSACYQFFVDLLKHLDKDDLNQLWILVKEYLSIRPASSDKEMEL
nr:hypothetical protein [Tanacetum cinerariifolium]